MSNIVVWVFSRAMAGAMLILVAPLLGVACMAIWLEDGFPVLFRQTRVGRYGQTFEILKLRSMKTGAPGPLLTQSGDRRITRTGSLLRRFKLDELPQLWNILRGDMNWIGPRPEVPVYVDRSLLPWREVLSNKPGITDLATLVFRDEETVMSQAGDLEKAYREEILPAKVALNLEYARARTWLSDAKLLALTARYSFLPHGFDSDRVRRSVLGQPVADTD